MQLQSTTFDSNSCLSPSVSDDSESSDEETDHAIKVHVQSESSDHDTDVKQNVQTNDECLIEENVELNVNIKQELIDEKINCEEVNEIGGVEHNEHVVNGETIIEEEIENTANEENEMKEENNDQDEQSELKPDDDKINQQQDNVKEDESSNSSGTVTMKQQDEEKSKGTVAVENGETSEMDSRKQIDIKQEPAEYEMELDPMEDMVDDDGVRRELRPRKLNDSHIYFEPYDGSLSEESDDFTDLLSD